MNSQTTYALLMRSEDKGRDLLETAAYAVCILSAVFAIWECAEQPVTLVSDKPAGPYAAPQVSQEVQLAADQES